MCHLSPLKEGETEAQGWELSSQHKPTALCPPSDASTFPPAQEKLGLPPARGQVGGKQQGQQCSARGAGPGEAAGLGCSSSSSS